MGRQFGETEVFLVFRRSRIERQCFFMGVGRYTPNTAVMGDVGWTNTESRQLECVINQWFRLRSMEVNRLNHRVFKWAYMQGNKRYKNWCIRVKHQFSESGFENYFWDVGVEHISKAFIKQQVKNTVFDDFKIKWRPYLERNNALRGREEISSELTGYLNRVMEKNSIFLVYGLSCNAVHIGKIRCGVAPLRIETGRYERLDVTERTCIICNTGVELEEHVLLSCSLYDDLREKLFRVVSNHVPDFEFFSNADKV